MKLYFTISHTFGFILLLQFLHYYGIAWHQRMISYDSYRKNSYSNFLVTNFFGKKKKNQKKNTNFLVLMKYFFSGKNRFMKSFFPHTPAESKFFLPLVFTKMLLSAKGMRENSILTSGGNKECHKSQA